MNSNPTWFILHLHCWSRAAGRAPSTNPEQSVRTIPTQSSGDQSELFEMWRPSVNASAGPIARDGAHPRYSQGATPARARRGRACHRNSVAVPRLCFAEAVGDYARPFSKGSTRCCVERSARNKQCWRRPALGWGLPSAEVCFYRTRFTAVLFAGFERRVCRHAPRRTRKRPEPRSGQRRTTTDPHTTCRNRG